MFSGRAAAVRRSWMMGRSPAGGSPMADHRSPAEGSPMADRRSQVADRRSLLVGRNRTRHNPADRDLLVGNLAADRSRTGNSPVVDTPGICHRAADSPLLGNLGSRAAARSPV